MSMINHQRYPAQGPGLDYLKDPGLWWPSYDERNQRHINYNLEHQDDWRTAAELSSGKKVVIQAGGSVGLWPKGLAEVFETVYTFEPHPDLYQCLVRNCTASNVIKLQALLGNIKRTYQLQYKSFGRHRFVPEAGIFPVIRVDDLSLDNCDLIVLDIEGAELFALEGAYNTIQTYRPIIQVEELGLEKHYDVPPGAVNAFLKRLDYRPLYTKVGHDRVYVPRF